MRLQYCILLLLTAHCIAMAQNNLLKNSCVTEDCHNTIMTKKVIHAPLIDGCETCHEKNSNVHPNSSGPEFTFVENGSELCETCHTLELSKKVLHMPYTEGSCIECHSPHSSNVIHLMSDPSMKITCERCHNLDENNFGHGPYMSDQCTSCHLGHQSDYKALLSEEEPYLCFKCHMDKEEDLELSVVHPVFAEGCLDCHLPHTSPAAYMLKSGESQLCTECHSEVENEISKHKFVHEPLTKGGQCVACHTPHAGELSNLLVTEQPNLCFNCHSENINNKEKYIDIFGRLKKEYVHKPIFDGLCTDCHLPHISDNNKLLTASFPKGNYTKPKEENFAMCFTCHDSKKITNRITNIDTGFRDGDKNLHSVHVMKKKAISCQSCHDMHGADNEHIVGNFVYFGKWEMPINFQINETGGTCLPGCHVQYSYNRNN